MKKTTINKQADAYLVEAEFANGWKDTKITKLIYLPSWEDVDSINPEMCSHLEQGAGIDVWKYLNKSKDVDANNRLYLDVVNQVADDLKKQLGPLYGIHVFPITPCAIRVCCPCIKVYQLTAGEKLPNGVILVYFGRWYTLGEVEKIIREYVEPYIKEHLGE